VRARSSELTVGDSVAVRTYVTEPDRPPKLEFPATGPYVVIEKTDTHVTLRTRDGPLKVHLDRVFRLPRPKLCHRPSNGSILEEERRLLLKPSIAMEEKKEFVVDQIVGHAADDDGNMLVKVRWFGCPSSADTWEPVGNLPVIFLRDTQSRNESR
jgi:Chromo (CHRromatin Organisation MOdifier) domain